MSGHSKWSQIKHSKGAADQKRGVLFSKLLKAVRAAVGTEPNPDFNPRLRTAVETAKAANVPLENITRAIEGSKNSVMEDILVEAYGPGGVAMLIAGSTDNRNRTIAELRKILSDAGSKIADPGSVMWAFENKDGQWSAKFPVEIDEETGNKLVELIDVLEDHDDVIEVTTNAA